MMDEWLDMFDMTVSIKDKSKDRTEIEKIKRDVVDTLEENLSVEAEEAYESGEEVESTDPQERVDEDIGTRPMGD